MVQKTFIQRFNQTKWTEISTKSIPQAMDQPHGTRGCGCTIWSSAGSALTNVVKYWLNHIQNVIRHNNIIYIIGGDDHNTTAHITATLIHRALCSLFQPDTDGTRVSKCRHFFLQRRGLDPMLFQCWSSAVGGGPILKQH